MNWLTERAQATPTALALLIGERRWTYGELDQLTGRLAAYLQAQGVRPGDFVAALLPNSLEYVGLIHALARLGAILVPLNTRLTEAEIAWQLEHVGARWVATDQEIVNCERLIVNSEVWETFSPSFTIHNSQFTIHNSQAVVFTSGTSGRPKGAMLTFANHYHSAMASAERLGVRADDLWLSVLPLYHVGGLAVVWRSCLLGTAVSLHPRFDLPAINHDLDHNPITLISLVPTMLHRLLQTRAHWPATLRLILLGGAAAPPELITQANTLPRKSVNSDQWTVDSSKFTIHNSQFTIHNSPPLIAPTYGLTEAASQVATATPAEAARKPGSAGKPLPGTTIQIVDEQGHPLPPNAIGEIVVTGPTVMVGYFNEQQRTVNGERGTGNDQSSIVNRQSSIATGDLGYLDEEGDLWLVQRRSDLIVSGGENVYPAEVEAVLRAHPAVENGCVVGVPDPEWGQKVAALVQLKPEQSLSEADLLAFCRERLAGYKQPRLLQFAPELPLTASGKIAREAVARRFA
jgi:o-succinylbenzoate---CoA ligase